MQVGIDVTYMYTNFGGCDLFSFEDIGTFKNGQISPIVWPVYTLTAFKSEHARATTHYFNIIIDKIY